MEQMEVMPARNDDDIVETLPIAAEAVGLSLSTFRRLIRAGDGPPLVFLSARRRGVKRGDRRAWTDGRRHIGATPSLTDRKN